MTSPRYASTTSPADGSIASSFVRRPAPSISAAMPSASLSIATIAPGRAAPARRGASASAARCPASRTRADRRPAPRRTLRNTSSARAVGEHPLDPRAALVGHLRDAAEHEHLGAEHVRQLARVGRAAAAQDLDRLADLERVADRAADRRVHVGQHARDRACRARVADRAHQRAQRARVARSSS